MPSRSRTTVRVDDEALALPLGGELHRRRRPRPRRSPRCPPTSPPRGGRARPARRRPRRRARPRDRRSGQRTAARARDRRRRVPEDRRRAARLARRARARAAHASSACPARITPTASSTARATACPASRATCSGRPPWSTPTATGLRALGQQLAEAIVGFAQLDGAVVKLRARGGADDVAQDVVGARPDDQVDRHRARRARSRSTRSAGSTTACSPTCASSAAASRGSSPARAC